MPDQVVDLVLRRVVGQALQELGQVLLAVEVVATLRRVVQVPGGLLQLLERRQEVGRLAQRRDEALDHLLARQPLHRVDRRREARGQQQRADLGRRLLARLKIDDLRVGRLLRVPEILGDHVAHAGDLGELVAHLRDAEVEVLRTDQEDVVRLAVPDGLEQPRDQLDQAARLLELLVLLEERDDVLEPRMKRIGGGDLVGDGLGAAVGRLGLGGFLELAAEGVGDVVDLALVGQRLEEPLAQDVVDLVRGEIHRRDVALLTAEFGACVLQAPC